MAPCWCSDESQRTSASSARRRAGIVLLLIILCTCSAGASAVLHACECNYGIVQADSEVCACQCFAGYLKPHCLYKATDEVVVKALWYGPSTTNTNSDAERPSVLRCARWPYWYDEAALQQTWQAALVSDAAVTGGQTARVVRSRCLSANANVSWSGDVLGRAAVMETHVALPGWAAQRLAVKSTQDDGMATLVPMAFGEEAALADVRCLVRGPAPTPRYVDHWMRINVVSNVTSNTTSAANTRRYWFLSLENSGWLIGGLLLALILLVFEHGSLFNTERNVGGGLLRASGAPPSAQGGPKTVAPRASRQRAAMAAPSTRPAAARSPSPQAFSLSPARDGAEGVEGLTVARAGLRRRQPPPQAQTDALLSQQFPNPLASNMAGQLATNEL